MVAIRSGMSLMGAPFRCIWGLLGLRFQGDGTRRDRRVVGGSRLLRLLLQAKKTKEQKNLNFLSTRVQQRTAREPDRAA